MTTSAGCARTAQLFCQGDNEHRESLPPKGERFTSISSGYTHTCGLRADGVAVCWGLVSTGSSSLLKDDRFTYVSVGRYHTCGVRDDKRDDLIVVVGSQPEVAVCWGSNAPARVRSLPQQDERFIAISSGWASTHALREDGVAVCWGVFCPLLWHPPEDERFTSISSGEGYACGLREDGTVVCWGGEASPLGDERFAAISIGQGDLCGLRKDGVAVCVGQGELCSRSEDGVEVCSELWTIGR